MRRDRERLMRQYGQITSDPEALRALRERQRQQYHASKATRCERANVKNLEIKREVFAHYGSKCACCGESIFEFLSIDHINNDGAAHRKELKMTGMGFYRWLRRNSYPPGYQLLCLNCNLAKGWYGICPHKKEPS